MVVVPGFVGLLIVSGGLWEVDWRTPPAVHYEDAQLQPTVVQYDTLRAMVRAEGDNLATLEDMRSTLRWGIGSLGLQLGTYAVISIVRVATTSAPSVS